ncbi:class I SAM-dependent methyltransferase [Candidatus Trichorickettsia mobilis]|uniref:class I SAM-dependent methyltransferase n=1 Tax=Candidatus Trichorickettsia mobilis TaxID=1346319 RepID=UPI002931853E|nr:class I SAM-dependent methyltransferase [Candidatus Trichorickettsia mobilis]
MVVFFFLPLEASSSSINFDSLNGNNMWYILSNDRGEKEVKDFINNVLRQCDADKFIEISHKTLSNKLDLSNAAFYSSLEHQISKTTPLMPFIAKVKSLHHQQKILSAQLQHLIGNRVVKNYVEIGTPGTYINSLKDLMLIEQATIINNAQGLIDYIHGSSWSLSRKFKSYDKFVPLNNYDAIAEEQILSNSVDVVSCVVGLHHIPTEKLQPFVSSIYRILKPGGIFILRDHDAKDDEVKSIVQAAHTIFNLVTMELDLQGEVKEYRNFQPLNYWIELLTLTGFREAACDKLYQAGDPTLNAMVKFIKPLQLESEVISEIEDYPYYKRDLTKTFLSAPEWHNRPLSKLD